MTSEDILAALNPEQARAASTIDGPVLVLAGAGTGKTRVITYRIAYMLSRGVAPESILGMTFTNKAAQEMRERLAKLVSPESAGKVTLGTFHAFCVKVLRREIQILGYLPTFTIADASDQQGLFKQAAAEIGWNKDEFPIGEMSNQISLWKNKLLSCKDTRNFAENDFEVACSSLYNQYQTLLEMQNMIDFDDMMLLVHKIFAEHPEILEKYCQRYRYLLVDEYQDTNAAQFTIVKMLAGKSCNLCVVGDDDQSIYGWRGADIDNILHFADMFKGTAVIKLEQNYRSTNKILNAANAVICANKQTHVKRLWSDLGEGEDLTIVGNPTGENEADFVAAMIRQLKSKNEKLRYKDIAILYRSNHLSRELERALRMADVPYCLVGGQEFFKRKEIKDAVSYLKVLVNPPDNQSFLRILATPPRGLAQKAVDSLKLLYNETKKPMLHLLEDERFLKSVSVNGAAEARKLSASFKNGLKIFAEAGDLSLKCTEFLRDCGYLGGLQRIYKDIEDSKNRRENVDEFLSSIAQYEAKCAVPPTLAEFLESFALLEENDRNDDKSVDDDGVILTTIHAAKGLEFPVCFLVALEDRIFPHERAIDDGSIDEELRLFYVAITRAKQQLFMTYAKERFIRGQKKYQHLSQFCNYLPEKLLQQKSKADLIKEASQEEIQAAFAKIFKIINS